MTSSGIEWLLSGTAGVPEGAVEAALRTSTAERRPLRVKLGIDPSGADLTLGHAVVLRFLRRFQELGHVAVLIIGDFTAQIGDPTGRGSSRPALAPERTAANGSRYVDHVRSILLPEPLEIHHNSVWLRPLSTTQLLGLARDVTVAQMLERRDFRARIDAGRPLAISEFLYPILQGYDSVVVQADVEIGGEDQLFNLLVGRRLQAAAGLAPQACATVPLLRGLDGGEKMGKSLGNYVAIGEPPGDQYGKLLSIGDDLVDHYAELCCDWDPDQREQVANLGRTDPFAAKRTVAHRIVALYHGAVAADLAADRFDRLSRRREQPTAEDLPVHLLDGDARVDPVDLLVASGLASSRNDARRLLVAGAIRLDQEPVGLDLLDPERLRGSVFTRGRRRGVVIQ